MNDPLQMEIRRLRGVGDVRAKQFEKLGVRTVEDLLFLFPRKYENWADITPINEATPGDTVCVRGVVSFPVAVFRTPKGRLVAKTMVTDGPGILRLTFFNNKYVKDQLREGEEYLFYGRPEADPDGGVMMTAPAFAPAAGNERQIAVYPLTAGLSSKIISKAVKTALETAGEAIPETLPEETLSKYRLCPIGEALRKIHFPKTEADIRDARRRLIYEELLVLQLGLGLRGGNKNAPSENVIERDESEAFWQRLPFTPTAAQRRAVRECLADIKAGRQMQRLLQGDVGSGKTAVAAALVDTMAKNGYQCAVMAPTEVLAAQHYAAFSRFFEGTGVRVALLTGSTTAAARRSLLPALEAGEIDVLIGTHAVISDKVRFHRLGLAVTDEQHRFGVAQRAALRNKGVSPHVLVMSATPIPRTLSMIVYGDLDISVLDEKPVGRQPIETFAVPAAYHPRLYAFLKKQIMAGRQAYLVCPLVEDEETGSAGAGGRIAAEQYYETLRTGPLKDCRPGLLHGKMKPAEKEAVMRDFAAGEIGLLVCTSVIEVGIDVPNAVVIVVENAECFGLSQLHQLRGRVGRGSEKSYCVLVSDAENEAAQKRFDILKKTDDGFQIAEADLEMRGPGDFFGNRQSGLPALKLADLMTDGKILYAARADAQKILAGDPALRDDRHALLRKKTDRLFAELS